MALVPKPRVKIPVLMFTSEKNTKKVVFSLVNIKTGIFKPRVKIPVLMFTSEKNTKKVVFSLVNIKTGIFTRGFGTRKNIAFGVRSEK